MFPTEPIVSPVRCSGQREALGRVLSCACTPLPVVKLWMRLPHFYGTAILLVARCAACCHSDTSFSNTLKKHHSIVILRMRGKLVIDIHEHYTFREDANGV